MLARLLALIAPSLCIACGADAGRSAPLCTECRARMRGTGGTVQLAGATASRPSTASGASPAGATCWAAFAYDGPAGAVVRAVKFGGRVALVDFMAAQIAAQAPPGLLQGAVVPVPVHPLHRRRRGLDHAGELARALARRARLEVADCLARTGDPRPQVGRGRRERVAGPPGWIALRERAAAPPAAVVVDDVLTTGATLGACVTALREAGTERITAVVYARTAGR